MISTETDDWAGVSVTDAMGEHIEITHPDEAALGRIYMELVSFVRFANGAKRAAEYEKGETNAD